MDRLIDLRHIWWQKGTLKIKDWIIMTLFPLWLRCLPSACSYPWLPLDNGLYTNWTLKVHFFMVSFQKKSIWSNCLALLLKGSLAWYVNCHSLHGLKQSPRVWFERFSIVIQEFAMVQCEFDHYVFLKLNKEQFPSLHLKDNVIFEGG